MTESSFDYDFAVAGGGPGGSAAAIGLASRGYKVLLVERDRFPRFHIGESLLSTANDHFRSLGIIDEIRAAGFPHKWGASLITADGRTRRMVDFATSREVMTPQTFQVDRARFDELLLRRAEKAGAEVREGERAVDAEFDDSGATIRIASPAGERSIRVRALVDATGRSGLLGKKYALRRDEPRLANIAIFAHYAGVPRLTGLRSGDIRLVSRADAGWFWFIPIGDDLMSVGVVLPKGLYLKLEHGSPEEMLTKAIDETPAAAELMRDAVRKWPVRVEKDFSYGAKQYAGDRWLLVGDAGSFLDPVFSTGVSIAMESGIEAAEVLDAAARRNRFRAGSYARFSRRQRRRFATFRRFVLAFYTPWFRDLFFQPDAPPRIYRAVVTILAGNWEPSLPTRMLIWGFFIAVEAQRRFRLSRTLFRRDPEAGFVGVAPLEMR